MSENLYPPHHSDDAGAHALSRAIDTSVRLPVIILFGNAVHWLVVAALLSLIVSIKLIVPGFLGGISFLSYGRLAPMARDLMLYGWASQAALAAGIWMMARLCGRPLGTGTGGVLLRTLIISATVLWNLAVLLGTLAIFAGYSTGVEWLEYPNWASAMLFLSFLLIGIWALLLFDRRASGRPEVAQWYLVAGFCSFPWVYGTANLLLTWRPIQASAQGPIQSWFCGGLLALWLLPVAVAALYALIPRILGVHLHRRDLATLGFWSLLFLGGWGGIDRLIGGPIPAWLTSLGVVTGILFIIPVVIIAINLIGTIHRGTPNEEQFTVFRFLRIGLYALIALGALGVLASMPGISGALNLTGFTEAKYQLWILGAVSFPLFAVLYKSLPLLLGRSCWTAALTGGHLVLTLVGFCLLVVLLLLGGLVTGLALNDPTVTFLNITSYSYPFHLLECVAGLVLLVAAVILGVNFTAALAGNYLFPKKQA
jgi:cytochrome c oxidase cbb3-type subunit 1